MLHHATLGVRHAALALLLLLVPPVPARTMVRLTGDVPPGISEQRLSAQYRRVCRQVAPRHGCGRSAVRVVFYREETQPRLAMQIPEWGGGGATGPDTVIVPLGKPFVVERDLEQVVLHELVHCAIIRAARGVHVPRWFHEGVAMTLAGQIDMEEKVALARAALLNNLLPFERVDQVNAVSRESALLAYSQSHAAVLFLVEKYGIETIGLIIDAAAAEGSFDAAVGTTLGLSPPELHALLARAIRERYGLAYVLGDLMYVWILIFALAVVAFFVVRHRRARRKQQMERDEQQEREELERRDTDGTDPADGRGPETGDLGR